MKMETLDKIDHSVNSRLYPPTYGNLYYCLNKLRTTIEKNLFQISNTLPNKQLLLVDISCGTKPYQHIVEKQGFKYLGADIFLNNLADIKIFANGDFGCEDNFADIVMSTQALEHVYDYDKYLSECYRITKPNCYLLLSTVAHWRYHPDPEDYWRWTSHGLKKTLERNNWKVESFEGIIGLSAIALQYILEETRNKLRYKIFIIPYTWLFQKLISLADRINDKNKNIEASTFVVLAKKVAS